MDANDLVGSVQRSLASLPVSGAELLVLLVLVALVASMLSPARLTARVLIGLAGLPALALLATQLHRVVAAADVGAAIARVLGG